MVNILVVDDNDKIRKLFSTYLLTEGYNVFEAENGEKALDIIERINIELLVLDIMMPKINGYELTEDLRNANYNFPILMITAKEDIEDIKRGFRLGTDDYMVKPVDMDEMILRVSALLRRAKISAEKKIVLDDIILDYDNISVITKDKTHILPKKEFYLLFKLISYPQKIFTRQQLMDEIWGLETEAEERTVDVHIKRLREKLGYIKEFEIITVRGLGYKVVKKV
ncbi:MAG: response regulator transcription factor [Clostridiales bacterium]